MLQRLARRAGAGERAQGQPVALDRMQHRDAEARFAPGQHAVDPGEVILDQRVLAEPRALVVDRGRVIALGLALHADPREMVHAQGDAQGRLPVAIALVAGEGEIPVGHAVELGHHALAAVLVLDALRLLGRGQVQRAAQLVEAGDLEAAVAAHRLADETGLAVQRLLSVDMAGEGDAVPGAPAAEGVDEGRDEALRGVLVEAPARRRGRAAGEIPEHLGQGVERIAAERREVAVDQIVGPRHGRLGLGLGGRQRLLHFEMRLVGEDRRHQAAEVLAHRCAVRLVGDLDEAADRLRIHRVDVGLAVVPAPRLRHLEIRMPQLLAGSRRGSVGQPSIAGQRALPIERHRVARQQPAARRRGIGLGREAQEARAETLLLGDHAAGAAGGPAILVVEPGAQAAAGAAVLDAGLDVIEKLGAQVWSIEAGAAVDVPTAHAHLGEPAGLAQQLRAVELAVPAPERRPAVFRTGLGKDRGGEVRGDGARVEWHGIPFYGQLLEPERMCGGGEVVPVVLRHQPALVGAGVQQEVRVAGPRLAVPAADRLH